MFKLHIIFVENIRFPRATYHTKVPSTEGLYCLNRSHHFLGNYKTCSSDTCVDILLSASVQSPEKGDLSSFDSDLYCILARVYIYLGI